MPQRFLFLLLALNSCQSPNPIAPPMNQPDSRHKVPAQQLVVVTAADANTIHATLQRYEIDPTGTLWNPVGESFPVVLGKNGLAWGSTFENNMPEGVSKKKEGDGKAPIGLYALSKVFGYPAQGPSKIDYQQVTPDWVCVDDDQSTHYNQVFDGSQKEKDWNSAEEMRRDDDLYKWGIVVGHNTAPAVPGCGSCIFMHIWRDENSPTAGCTAMTEARIFELVNWLDASKNPMLLQGTPQDLAFLRQRYVLP